MVVVLWLVLFRCGVGRARCGVGRGSVAGRLDAVLRADMLGRAVGGAGEQGHEADRHDRADLSGPPGQLGEAAKARVPRGRCRMPGPARVTGVGVVVCPALAPEWLRVPGVGGLTGNGGLAPERVMSHPAGRTIVQGSFVRRLAAGVVRVGGLCCPVSRTEPERVAVTREVARIRVLCGPAGRAEPGAGRFRRWYRVLAQPEAGPAWWLGLDARPEKLQAGRRGRDGPDASPRLPSRCGGPARARGPVVRSCHAYLAAQHSHC